MFDLDKVIAEGAKTPARAKKPKPFPFTFDGDTYTLSGEIDTLALAAAGDGDLLGALRRLLGPAQFEKIKASPVMLTVPTLTALMEAYYTHLTGLSVGEAPASPRSSKPTARPSKRTSKRTTASRSRR